MSFSISLEAIRFQPDRKLFNALVAEIKNNPLSATVSDETGTSKYWNNTAVAKIVEDHTHIKISLGTMDFISGAAVRYPAIDINHPLINTITRDNVVSNMLKSDAPALAKLIRSNNLSDNIGWVDLRTSKVHGVFRKIMCPVFLSTKAHVRFTPEELAAVILHEVGHIWAYFEYICTYVIRNYVLAGISAAVMQQEDQERRILILETAKDVFHLDDLNTQEAAKVGDQGSLQMLLLDMDNVVTRSELGSYLHDDTSFEYLADQFSARHGAELPLVTALAKVGTDWRSTSADTTFALINVGSIVLVLAGSVVTMGALSVMLLALGLITNPLSDSYDDPKNRFTRIRQQTVERLKDKRISNKDRQYALETVAELDKIIETMYSRRTWFQFVFSELVPKYRKQFDQLNLQKQLETIANNDLFVSSATFKHMKPTT